MNRALVIGIDKYEQNPLFGCVNDAVSMASLLERNGDGSPNFSVKLLTSDTTGGAGIHALREAIAELFASDAENIVLYFAGHGVINHNDKTGYLVAQDTINSMDGYNLTTLLGLANAAYPKIKSVVIMIDCCHSGYLGEHPPINNSNIAHIGKGVTILAACRRGETAKELNGHGLFTSIILDGLKGGASDICGRITPAILYSHVDQTLGPWGQRPIYMANVATFVTLRTVNSKVPMEVLRRLPTYFPEAAFIYKLDPSFEPDRNNVPDEYKSLPVNNDHVRIFTELQMCNRHGLVEPVDAPHMYYAAINSTGCKLTAAGNHYRNLALEKAI